MSTPGDAANGPAGPRTLPCPACAADFVVGVPRCAACGLLLTGPLAVRLWQIDQDILSLEKSRAGALDELRVASTPDAAASLMTQPYAGLGARSVTAAAAAGERAEPAAAAPPSSPWSDPPVQPREPSGGTAQHVLLGFGVLLLFMASVVFVAVAWDALGVYGRMFVLLLAIAASAGLAAYCSDRRLAASAEGFAILAVGVSVVGLSAAYALDLFGAGALSVRVYVAVAAALLTGLAAVAHRSAPPVMTYPLVALAGGWAAAFALLADSSVLGFAGGLVAGWVVLASPSLRWARTLADPADALTGSPTSVWSLHGAAGSRLWAPLWPPALLSGVVGTALATLLVASGTASAVELVTATLLAAASLAVVGHALRVDRPFADLPQRLVVPSLTVWVLVGVEVAALVRNAGPVADVVLAAVCILLLVLLLCIRSQRTQTWSPHVGTVAVGAGVTASGLVVLDGDTGASAFVLALVAAGAAALAVAEPPWRPRAELVGVSTGIASLAFALVAVDASSTVATFAFSVGGVLLAVLGAARRDAGNEEEAILGVAAVVALAVSVGVALTAAIAVGDDGSGSSHETIVLAAALSIAAALAFAYALIPHRGQLVVAGLPLAIAAVWTVLADQGVDGLESYTSTAAIVCAVVGFAIHLRVRDASSWITVGPALSFALLPSALVATATDSAVRLAYVLLVGAVVLLLGFTLRRQALFAIAAAALVLVSVQELFLLVVGLPPTLTFLVAGAVLVGAAVRYERNMRDLKAVGVWFDQMS